MEKFDQCFLFQLQPGDRFYFAGDRHKKIHTLSTEKPFEVKAQKGYRITYANCRSDNPVPGQLIQEQFKAKRRVIYLRNINQKILP
jgi:hypothetical protein